MIENLLIGALGSLLASVIFLLCLSRLKPSLQISDELAHSVGDDGWHVAVKIKNTGMRSAIDITVELLFIEESNISGVIPRKIHEIHFYRNYFFMLEPIILKKKDFGATFSFYSKEFSKEEIADLFNEKTISYHSCPKQEKFEGLNGKPRPGENGGDENFTSTRGGFPPCETLPVSLASC